MSDDAERPSSILLLHRLNRGGIVCDADLACSIGALLLERHYGVDQLKRQQPLSASDQGEYWRVEGAWNRDRKLEGFGSFFLSIHKFDGRVTDFGVWGAYHPDPNALARIKGGMSPGQ